MSKMELHIYQKVKINLLVNLYYIHPVMIISFMTHAWMKEFFWDIINYK